MTVEFLGEDSSENLIDISNTADWFSFKKDEKNNDPFAINLEEIKKLTGLG